MPLGARVPYSPLGNTETGVTPAEGAPDDALRVQASPQDFGAQVGQKVEQAGQTAEELGAKYSQMATEASAENTIANQFVPAAAKLKGDFLQKQGMDAVKAEPQYVQSLVNLRQQFLDKANGPYESLILNSWMSRHAAQETDFAAQRASQQQEKFEADSHTAMLGLFSNTMAMNYNNPDVIDRSIESGKALVAKRGIDTGESPEMVQFKQSQFVGDAVKNAIDSATYNGDIPAAKQLFEKYKPQISPKDMKDLDVSLAPKVADYDARKLVDDYFGHDGDRYNHIVYGQGVHPENNKVSDPSSYINWTMQHEGGFVANDSGKGPSKFGINQEENPNVDVANLTQEQAAKIMHDKYWLGVGADKMSPDMGRVAFDTAVNMGVSKAQALATEAGNDPQKLIDLRRAEYQRLATTNPEKYGPSLAGWNNRLDDLQKTLHGGDIATDGKTIPNVADFYKANYDRNLDNIRAQAEQMRPGDLKFADNAVARADQHMKSVIEQTNRVNESDKNTIMKAVNGDLSKGQIPMTHEELLASSPEAKAAMESAQKNNPEFYNTVDTLIAKSSAKIQNVNSPNGYDNILRSLLPVDDPNSIKDQQEVDSLFGKKDSTGINKKDYKDINTSLGLSDVVKKSLRDNMLSITGANGNADGQGQVRALNFFNQASKIIEQNNALPSDKRLSDSKLKKEIEEAVKDQQMPSRMEMYSNWARALQGGANFKTPYLARQQDMDRTTQQNNAPVLTSKAQFDALPSGATYVRDGVTYRKP